MNPKGATASHRIEDQGEVEAFLTRTEHYGGTPPKRIDTHGATLFLGPELVIKIKKAVKYPYLDFSTQDRRRVAIERELERGTEFAPPIYRDRVPITREADGSLAIDGTGEPVEWALRMNRFDEADMASSLADAGRLNGALAEDLGERIAAMHDAAPAKSGGAVAIAAVMRENFSTLAEFPDLFPAAEVKALASASEAAFTSIEAQLDRRGLKGHVRLCHGDLHLANIVMLNGVPTPFDAIEFDDAIATTDTFYDLAYLLMDLWQRGLREAANRLTNRYLEATGDDDGLATLPLFLSIRAAIRAKIWAATGRNEAARSYFSWALKFLEKRPPVLVAIGGFSGTGKTTVARRIAAGLGPAPGAIVIRTDTTRKALAGVAQSETLPPSAYTKPAQLAVYAAVETRAKAVLDAGHAAIIDAVNAREHERQAWRQLSKEKRIEFYGLWLDAPKPVLIDRVQSRRGDASDADAQVVERQLAYDIGPLDWPIIDASGTPREVAAHVKAAIGGGM